jgi:hypothetical protein
MAIDFTRYQPPGIYTENVGGPQLAVRSSVPTAVAIFGSSVGYRTHRESLVINSDAPNTSGDVVPQNSKTLAKTGIRTITGLPKTIATANVNVSSPGATINSVSMVLNDRVYLNGQTVSTQNGLYTYKGATTPLEPVIDTFKVVNPFTGYTFINGLDYQVVKVGTGNPQLTTDRDDLYAIKRIDRGANNGIQQGNTVQVSYRYTGVDRERQSGDYFDVHAYYDYDDVRDHYGEPFDANGGIQSEITLAAKFAFMNGASTVLTCAVDTDSWPTEEKAYEEALKKFRDEEQIAVVVPGTGDSYIYPLVKSHVNVQSNNKYERRAIVGIDGSSGSVASSVRIGYAQALTDQRVAMVSPSRFSYYAPELGQPITLGGQYMAAAVAGRAVSQIAAMPLTRKIIQGFDGPDENPIQREGEKNLESDNGLMVVEKTRRGQIQVRHGVTTDPTELLTREWSIIGQQDVMVYRVRDFLDADGLIGMPIYDTTLIQVKASAESALVSLVRDGIIVGYQNLKVRQISTLPDVIEVRYEWRPAYPLNYIVVRYSVAVMTGDVTLADANG